jgi:hypothetical protein
MNPRVFAGPAVDAAGDPGEIFSRTWLVLLEGVRLPVSRIAMPEHLQLA